MIVFLIKKKKKILHGLTFLEITKTFLIKIVFIFCIYHGFNKIFIKSMGTDVLNFDTCVLIFLFMIFKESSQLKRLNF